jgi:hypothetical protein
LRKISSGGRRSISRGQKAASWSPSRSGTGHWIPVAARP